MIKQAKFAFGACLTVGLGQLKMLTPIGYAVSPPMCGPQDGIELKRHMVRGLSITTWIPV